MTNFKYLLSLLWEAHTAPYPLIPKDGMWAFAEKTKAKIT